MNEKEFKREYKKLQKLLKKGDCKGFIGYGYWPLCKSEYLTPIMKQMNKCMEFEPFLEYLREGIE